MRELLYKTVRDEEISEDIPFILSCGFDLTDLKTSLSGIGQLSPLVLHPSKEGLRIICGYRRRLALRELKVTEYSAYILPEKMSPAETLIFAIEDNLGHREFNNAEKALAVKYLAVWLEPEEITKQYLPRLGLPPRSEYLESFLRLAELDSEDLSALARGDLDPDTGRLLFDIKSDEDRSQVVLLLKNLRPGLNKRRQIITWLYEISRREETSVTAILAEDEFQKILTTENLNRPDREKHFRQVLRTRRFPELSRIEEKQSALISRLKLPGNISLEPPLNFEGLDFYMKLRFRDKEGLRAAITQLERLADRPEMDVLFELG